MSEASAEERFFGVQTEIKPAGEAEVEIEVIDDTPEGDQRPRKAESEEPPVDDESVDAEISNYSKRAADRINQIKYEYHEERRAKESADRIAKEATTRLQSMLKENQRLQKVVEEGGNVINKAALNNALWAKHGATEQYKKAYEEGDSSAMAQAQELLSKATLAEQQAGFTAQQVQNHALQANASAGANNAEQQQAPPRQLDPDMERWYLKNPWFLGVEPLQKEMTAYAMTIDQRLRNQGTDPGEQAEKYYSEVDRSMRNEFPSFFGVQQNDSEMVVEHGTSKRQPQTVVASVTRDSGNKKPSQIRLSKSQIAVARQLGITPEQYANQVMKGEIA